MTADTPQDVAKAEQEHAELSSQLHHHNYLYHSLDTPEISDADYDQLREMARRANMPPYQEF